MKLKCIAVDDEKFALDLLEDNINRVPYLQLVARCRNAMEAEQAFKQDKIDLIITDIQMPGSTGLQFIQHLFPRPLVIFVTAYEHYALNAFNVDAIDYLVKPVAYDRFLQATNKALLFSSYNQSVSSSLEKEPEFIFFNVEYHQVKVILSEVLYMEGLKDYIRIHLRNNRKPLLTRITMKSIMEILPASKFIRIHRSFIVSLMAVTVIKKDSLLLDPSIELPIGDSYKENIQSLLKGF